MMLPALADTIAIATKPVANTLSDSLRNMTHAVTEPRGMNLLARLEPWMLTVIIVGTMGALILSLWMVYSYINRIRTDEIRREMLYDAVFDSRLRRLQEQYGLLNPPLFFDPDEREARRAIILEQVETNKQKLKEMEQQKIAESDPMRYVNLKMKIEEDTRVLKTDLSEASIKKLREDIQMNKMERDELEKRVRQEAAQHTKLLVPASLTVAGMGITGSFFIELTAILTIIFGIITLGMGGVLSTTEIAPILAAIAGYVLGKTTSGWAPYGGANWLQQPPVPSAASQPPTTPLPSVPPSPPSRLLVNSQWEQKGQS